MMWKATSWHRESDMLHGRDITRSCVCIPAAQCREYKSQPSDTSYLTARHALLSRIGSIISTFWPQGHIAALSDKYRLNSQHFSENYLVARNSQCLPVLRSSAVQRSISLLSISDRRSSKHCRLTSTSWTQRPYESLQKSPRSYNFILFISHSRYL